MLGLSSISGAAISAIPADGYEHEGSASTSAAATTSATCNRVQNPDASLNAAATLASAATRVRESSGLSSGINTTLVSYERVREFDPSLAGQASLVVSYERVQQASGNLNAALTFNATAAYTTRSFGSTSETSATAINYIRRRHFDGSSSAASSTTAAAGYVKYTQGIEDISGSLSVACHARYTAFGGVQILGELTTVAKPSRVLRFDGISITQGSSGVLVTAREKWEPVPVGSQIWTEVINDDDSWTTLSSSSGSWTNI